MSCFPTVNSVGMIVGIFYWISLARGGTHIWKMYANRILTR